MNIVVDVRTCLVVELFIGDATMTEWCVDKLHVILTTMVHVCLHFSYTSYVLHTDSYSSLCAYNYQGMWALLKQHVLYT